MHHSKHRPRSGAPAGPTRIRSPRLPLAAAICLAMASPALAHAQDAAQTSAPPKNAKIAKLQVVTVTAQKRTQDVQSVPVSIDVLDGYQLRQLHVSDFNDYAQYLPSVSYQTFGPGFALIYMRGVASGGDGNHSGSLPSVGVYLDEEPVTTIQGPLDIHMYDIARVEALAGPQGTLYGASAEAGALRIITNPPDPSGFAANYTVDVNSVAHGGIGNTVEGMINIPLSNTSAIRLVAWHEHDAGYIDNVVGSRTFPSSGITVNNGNCTSTATLVCTNTAKNHYNDVVTNGARAALKVQLNDNWSVTSTVMGQQAITNGNFAYDPVVGDLKLTHYYPDTTNDRWWQAALTLRGKIGNFDLTYAYAHLKRSQNEQNDYSDYSFWYDTLYGSGAYIYDNSGNLINPSQYILGRDGYTMDSHELRIASPRENRLRFVAGVFSQRQSHNIEQRYMINGLANVLSVTGWPNTLWLTEQVRVDRDQAAYGELSYDIIPHKLTATVGGRYFRSDNSLGGFYGFSQGYAPSSTYGQAGCISPTPYNGAPCTDFSKEVKETGTLGKINLTWHITPTKMLYLTRSEGYRPGGVNRRGSLPPYKPDFLTNLELGWKTMWLNDRLSFNGAVFRENWNDFQFSILGANGLTEIKNANQAKITGLESQLSWAATYNLQIGGGMAIYNPRLTANYCGFTDLAGNPISYCPAGTINPITGTAVSGPVAPTGTPLPVTPRFKGNITARYTVDSGDNEWYLQGSFVHVGERRSALPVETNNLLGNMAAYTVANFSAGIKRDNWSLDVYVNNAFDTRAQLFKYTECAEQVCAAHNVVPQYPNGQVYIVSNQPRTIGIRFMQNF